MLLCFDYDGVIADTFDTLLNICKESQAVINAGRPPVDDDFRLTENLTFDHLAAQLEIPKASVSEFAQQVFSRLGAEADRVFTQIPSVLRQLAVDHTLCVVTANTVSKVTTTLDAEGISDCFACVLGGESGLAKSDQIIHAATTAKLPVSEAVMVGDTFGDIRMAKVAGVRSIAVTWGYQRTEFLAKAKPDAFAAIPHELVACVEQLTPVQP